jgi:hypothetical protein
LSTGSFAIRAAVCATYAAANATTDTAALITAVLAASGDAHHPAQQTAECTAVLAASGDTHHPAQQTAECTAQWTANRCPIMHTHQPTLSPTDFSTIAAAFGAAFVTADALTLWSA